MDEEINQLVSKYGIGKMELMRYLLAAGLARVHTNGLGNDLQEVRAVKLQMPVWRSE
jgi:arginine repressor